MFCLFITHGSLLCNLLFWLLRWLFCFLASLGTFCFSRTGRVRGSRCARRSCIRWLGALAALWAISRRGWWVSWNRCIITFIFFWSSGQTWLWTLLGLRTAGGSLLCRLLLLLAARVIIRWARGCIYILGLSFRAISCLRITRPIIFSKLSLGN